MTAAPGAAPASASAACALDVSAVLDARLTSALVALGRAVEDLGYRHLYAAGVGPLFAGDHGRALAALEEWPAAERQALRLLAFGATAAVAELPAELGGAVGLLVEAGLVTRDGPSVRADGWVLVPVLAGHVLTGVPPGYPGADRAEGRAYLGPDSLRLAAALPSATGRRVLDLGAGCGVQGLLAVNGAESAVLVDVEPRSLELATWNAVLNRVTHPVRVLEGDLYSPVADERFDLIVTLPPYVPEVAVAAAAQTVVTAGGPDGLALLRRVVAGAAARLNEGGELVAVCQLLCRDDEPLLAAELSSLAPELDARLVVGEWHPLQPYVLDLASELVARTGGDVRALLDGYRTALRRIGATGVCTATLRLRRPVSGGAGPAAHRRHGPARHRVVGTKPLGAGRVVRQADGVTVRPDASLRVAAAPGVAPVVLEAPTAALLEALDGHRTVAEAAVAAWGRLEGADERDVADQAVRRLERLGQQRLVQAVSEAPGDGQHGGDG